MVNESQNPLAATLAAEQVPDEVYAVPSMLAYDERRLLHWAARCGTDAPGVIVDAGCFVGGSTLALGFGEQESSIKRPIHSFDLFQVGTERDHHYFSEGFEATPGASTLSEFERNVAPVRHLVDVHAGDINQFKGWRDPVAVLFIDIAKSWNTNDSVVSLFVPHLSPGALVIQQDLVHWGHPWCAITMELLDDYFEFLGFVTFSSAVYRVRKPVPAEAIPTRLKDTVTKDDAVKLVSRCAERIGPPGEGYVRLAIATVAWMYGDTSLIEPVTAGVERDYTDAQLPWVTEHIEGVRSLKSLTSEPIHG
jgi:hypothetical protein